MIYSPTPLAALQARYPRAVEAVYPPWQRTGDKPEHVFDFEDGVRLIVSRHDNGHGGDALHVSGSVDDSGEMWQRALAEEWNQNYVLAFFVSKFRILSGDTRPMIYIGLSPGKGVPHWIVEGSAVPHWTSEA